MHKLLRARILTVFGVLIIGIIGSCGDDGTEDIVSPPESEADVGPLSTTYVVIDPLPLRKCCYSSMHRIHVDV